MSSDAQVTTIQITVVTRQELRTFGRKGETYDDIVRRLMVSARKSAFFEEMDRIVEEEEFAPVGKI